MPLIPTKHTVTGHEAELPEASLPAWRTLGWVPISELDESSTPDVAQEPTPAPAQPKAARLRADKSEE